MISELEIATAEIRKEMFNRNFKSKTFKKVRLATGNTNSIIVLSTTNLRWLQCSFYFRDSGDLGFFCLPAMSPDVSIRRASKNDESKPKRNENNSST